MCKDKDYNESEIFVDLVNAGQGKLERTPEDVAANFSAYTALKRAWNVHLFVNVDYEWYTTMKHLDKVHYRHIVFPGKLLYSDMLNYNDTHIKELIA